MVKCFWSASKNDETIYENIRKIDSGQEDDYTTVRLLDYFCFKEN